MHRPSKHTPPPAPCFKPASPMVAHPLLRKERLLDYLYRRIAALEMENEQLDHWRQAFADLTRRHQALMASLAQGADSDAPPMPRSDGDAVAPQADMDMATRRILELTQANEALQRKIDDRFITEKALRDREAELEMEKTNLQEANTALKVLLKRREEDKRALEEQVMYNVKKLVLPFLGKVQKENLDERQKSFLGIVEANLRDITCGFSRRLSLAYYGLTTSELKVANFIRQGKKNREIAELLNLSVRTVEAYRQAIRNKLRLQNKKVNLRTFLMSIH
ncbi:MAG: helix-turn-helix transcriptional regulator [Desulfobacterales bacterium]|nr:helix-turn-helix transcriptional regulator [Desulfobacterales bacterium]